MRDRLPRPLRAALSLLLAFGLLSSLACGSAPSGPAFRWDAAPPDNRGRVYLYRSDPRGSLSTVKASIDGRDIGTFRDREYETLELAAGSHRLRARMTGMGFFNLGWNEHSFRVRPGEVVFLQIQVRIDDRNASGPLAAPRSLEISGRSDTRMSENVFLIEQSRAEAEEPLRTTTRLPGDT